MQFVIVWKMVMELDLSLLVIAGYHPSNSTAIVGSAVYACRHSGSTLDLHVVRSIFRCPVQVDVEVRGARNEYESNEAGQRTEPSNVKWSCFDFFRASG